jgi:hypothetical protein
MNRSTASDDRQTAITCVGVCLGMNVFSSCSDSIPYIATDDCRAIFDQVQSVLVLDRLDAKSANTAALIFARCISELDGGTDRVLSVGGASTEPRNLSRLPVTSTLRAVFDTLSDIATGRCELRSR